MGWLGPCCEALPDPRHVHPVSCQHEVRIQRLEVEAAELASLVQKTAHTPGVWSALATKTRPSLAVHGGDRRHPRAEPRWAKSPLADRQHATCYTDQDVVYAKVLPAAQHQAIRKWARQPKHVERFNTTRRQRVPRLVREALSCSTKLANHSGAIQRFIGHDNLTRATA
jgi:IS1 family transposase